ncbi:hypothetical protein [Streptosporangium sp. NPDC000396]|uniref:hypothetical protein n=1 Tax=Streptosporangium sp. NPDC000396 TaxID=3366185 RepID=UPI00369BA306
MGRRLAEVATISALLLPMLAGFSGSAQAETNPACSRVTQIGSTGYVDVGGQEFASVKQFKGCGKNWAYLFVWASYRRSHGSWNACVSIATKNSSGGRTMRDVRCDNGRFTELWSSGADTLRVCTVALGWKGNGPFPYRGEPTARTSERC